jgi:hypothetical protein
MAARKGDELAEGFSTAASPAPAGETLHTLHTQNAVYGIGKPRFIESIWSASERVVMSRAGQYALPWGLENP